MNKKNVLIIGGGISGFGAAKLANHMQYKTSVTSIKNIDIDKKDILINLGIQLEEGLHSTSKLDIIDLKISSTLLILPTSIL